MTRAAIALAALGLVAGCDVTPLTNKIAVGEEAFVIVVGEGPDGNTDLFAAPAGGGTFHRITFNRPVESFPRLAPSGRAVAFVRQAADARSAAALVVLDLGSMAEAIAPLPPEARPAEGMGWTRDGSRIVVRAASGWLDTPAPPAKLGLAPVGPDQAADADTATRQMLGTPAFGVIDRCNGTESCVRAGADTTPLGPDVRDPIRWGSDSLGYLSDGRLEIRPLGAGRPRIPVLTGSPRNLRQLTHYPGSAAR